eukprot:scaffold1671_cov344-Pavlova_lutheri.AAC.4
MEASSGIAVRCELACRRAGGNGAENLEVKLWYAAGRGELDPSSYLLGFGDAPASKKHCVMMNLPWYTCTTAHGCGMAQPHRRTTETLSFAARPGQRMRQGVRVCCWGPTALAYRAHVWHSTDTLLVRVTGVRSRTRFSLHDIRILLQGKDPCRHNGSLWSEPFYQRVVCPARESARLLPSGRTSETKPGSSTSFLCFLDHRSHFSRSPPFDPPRPHPLSVARRQASVTRLDPSTSSPSVLRFTWDLGAATM